MDGLSAERIVELFEKDVGSRKRLAELLVVEPDVRLAIINALIRDVATKEDIEKLRAATKEDIENLRKATKEDIKNLGEETKKDIENLRKATKEDIENLRKVTKEDMESLRRATKEDMERLKAELKSYIDEKVNSINLRVSDLYGVVKASLVAIVVTLASTILVPLMLRIVFRA
jgi:arginine utilization protein RocB